MTARKTEVVVKGARATGKGALRVVLGAKRVRKKAMCVLNEDTWGRVMKDMNGLMESRSNGRVNRILEGFWPIQRLFPQDTPATFGFANAQYSITPTLHYSIPGIGTPIASILQLYLK